MTGLLWSRGDAGFWKHRFAIGHWSLQGLSKRHYKKNYKGGRFIFKKCLIMSQEVKLLMLLSKRIENMNQQIQINPTPQDWMEIQIINPESWPRLKTENACAHVLMCQTYSKKGINMDLCCNKIKQGLTISPTFHRNLDAAPGWGEVRAGQHALFVGVSQFTVTRGSHACPSHQPAQLISADFHRQLNPPWKRRGKYKARKSYLSDWTPFFKEPT